MGLLLPEPPSSDGTKPQADIRGAFALYYWPRHFEQSSVDPVSFVERVFDDFAFCEDDIVGQWLENMSPLYKAYKACLQHGLRKGSPEKQKEVMNFRNVF